ncbi:hypothetical protein M2138_001257 [Dysgonomonadaceae bacterium PH5-43]|nr:hypothetical protein [Dysgonomonadaceae bacterium PH5-43]
MKKLFYLLLVALAFVACDDDNSGGGNYYQPFDLKGRTYYKTTTTTEGEEMFSVLEFKSMSSVVYSQRKETIDGEIVNGPNNYSCKFDYPALNIYEGKKVIATAHFENEDATIGDSLYVQSLGGLFLRR